MPWRFSPCLSPVGSERNPLLLPPVEARGAETWTRGPAACEAAVSPRLLRPDLTEAPVVFQGGILCTLPAVGGLSHCFLPSPFPSFQAVFISLVEDSAQAASPPICKQMVNVWHGWGCREQRSQHHPTACSTECTRADQLSQGCSLCAEKSASRTGARCGVIAASWLRRSPWS